MLDITYTQYIHTRLMRKIFENVKLITKIRLRGAIIIHHAALVGTYYNKFLQSLITVNTK